MKHGFVRTAAATPKIRVADPEYNAAQIIELIGQGYSRGVKIMAFPELCLTGYTCGDLFLQSSLLEKAREELGAIVNSTKGKDTLVFFGLPWEREGKLYNTAAAVQNGRLLGLIPKQSLPNYSEFYEARHFCPGNRRPVMCSWDGGQVPMGANLLFKCTDMPGLTVAVEICEDLWVPCPPSTNHAVAGATVVVNCSASDETIGKDMYRRELVCSQSARLLCAYIYANAGEGESTQDLVFGGQNMIAENGACLVESRRFVNESVCADIDLERLASERRRMNTFPAGDEAGERDGYMAVEFSFREEAGSTAGLGAGHPAGAGAAGVGGVNLSGAGAAGVGGVNPPGAGAAGVGGVNLSGAGVAGSGSGQSSCQAPVGVNAGQPAGKGSSGSGSSGAPAWDFGSRAPRTLPITSGPILRFVDPAPFVPQDPRQRSRRCEEILSIQAMGLKKRMEHTGCRHAVLGLSGGLDSTLALLVTVRAFDLLKLPRTHILCVTMPCFGTTDRTYSNACALASKVGARLKEINIRQSVTQHFADIGQDVDNHDVTYENAQARERTQILMDLANQIGGLVIGTGDMSELALGWATYNGDHMSMYGVNASVPKTLVRHLVAYCGDTCSEKELSDVLSDILDTPVSPELLPPEDGQISQRTEDLVGPYELHDFYLYYILRYGFSPSKIYRLARQAFEGRYEGETILRWLKVFYRRFFSQQFKRSCLPDGPKVGTVALSPRGDLRMPSDASARLWMKELEELENSGQAAKTTR